MAYEDALVKGEPVLQMLGYVKKRRGMDGVNQVLDFTNQKHSAKYNYDTFKEMDWYSMPHYDAMLEEMERVFPSDEKMFTKACSHFIENMGIMKYFVKFAMSPQQLLKRASKDFNKFYSAGELRVLTSKKNHVELLLTDFPTTDHWNRSFGGFLEALTVYVTKAENVNCKIKMDYKDKEKPQCWFITDWD